MKLNLEACSLAQNQVSFSELDLKNSHFAEIFSVNGKRDIFTMYITLDSEIKNYKARVYGIIDAIGTLGGAFEIIF